MFQVGNMGIALRHDFQTDRTVAFAHGWNIFANMNVISGTPVTPHAEAIFDLTKSTFSCLEHPLLLPVVLLNDHLTRELLLQADLSGLVTDIEHRLGTTKSGQLAMSKGTIDPELRKMMSDADARIKIIELLNTTSTNLVNLKSVLAWDRRYATFLHQTNSKIRRFRPSSNLATDEEIYSLVGYLEGGVDSSILFVEAMLARLELQHNAVSKTE